MASLEYVTAGWLRSRRLARAGAVEACALNPCPVREGDWGSGTFCREALAPLRGELPGVFRASVGLVLFVEESDGVGAGELRGVAFWAVRGAAALV